jgi:hypothetical protein
MREKTVQGVYFQLAKQELSAHWPRKTQRTRKQGHGLTPQTDARSLSVLQFAGVELHYLLEQPILVLLWVL